VIKELCRYEETQVEDADLIIVAYGASARISQSTLNTAHEKGLKIGLFRPITLWPFPYDRLNALAKPGRKFLAVEMSMGQMVEDVRLAVNGKAPVGHYGRVGGMIHNEEEVLAAVERMLGK
jgi:2-oxoglutarate ferredoxin oxidoreductase subunit alpha